MELRCQLLEDQLGSDRNRGFQRTIDRTPVGEETVDAACSFSVGRLGFQFQDDMDAPDHQHVVF